MNLFYRSSKVWDVYKDADYIFAQHFAPPLRSDELFVKVAQDGLIISSTIKGLKEPAGEKTISKGLRKILLEDLLNVTKPYHVKFSNIVHANLDYQRGLLELILPNEKVKYRIVQATPHDLQQAVEELFKTLHDANVSISQKQFKFYERWNRMFLIFIILAVAAITILVVFAELN